MFGRPLIRTLFPSFCRLCVRAIVLICFSCSAYLLSEKDTRGIYKHRQTGLFCLLFFCFYFYFFFLIGCPRNVVIVLPGEVLSFPSCSASFNHSNSSSSNDFGLIVRERFTWGQSNLLRVEVIFYFFEPKYFLSKQPRLI